MLNNFEKSHRIPYRAQADNIYTYAVILVVYLSSPAVRTAAVCHVPDVCLPFSARLLKQGESIFFGLHARCLSSAWVQELLKCRTYELLTVRAPTSWQVQTGTSSSHASLLSLGVSPAAPCSIPHMDFPDYLRKCLRIWSWNVFNIFNMYRKYPIACCVDFKPQEEGEVNI